jgi:hypothetical protein
MCPAELPLPFVGPFAGAAVPEFLSARFSEKKCSPNRVGATFRTQLQEGESHEPATKTL